MEDSFKNYAESTEQNSVVLCDRGLMDGSAYIDQARWELLLNEVGLDTISARDAR